MTKFLAIFASMLIALSAFGQEAAVKYNPNTGALAQPTAGKRPLVAAANVLEYSTDADLALTNAHNTVVWDVPAQAATRAITLPDIGDEYEQIAQPVFIYIADANADSVEVYDGGATLLATMTAAEFSRVTFYPIEDDGTWLAVNQTFGTAAYVNTGTSAANVPTVADADTRFVNATGNESITGVKTITGANNGIYAGSGTSRAGARVHPNGSEGLVVWEAPGQGTDAKNWDTVVVTNTWALRLSNDTYGSATGIYEVTRSGMSVGSHTWRTGASVSTMTLTAASGHQAQGTTTNNAATAGWKGEQIASTVAVGSAVSLTTDTPANVTSISLTAGDWDISGTVYFAQAAGTTATYYTAGVGNTSATLPGYAGAQVSLPGTGATITGYTPSAAVAPTRVSLASTTTFYLVAQSAFGVDTLAAYGHLRARRMR